MVSRSISNLQLNQDHVLVAVNTAVYPRDVVFYAAYVFLDRSYVVIDGNPESELVVELRPKDKSKDLEDLGREFNNELLSYAVYKIQLEQNKSVRDLMLAKTMQMIESPDPLRISNVWDDAMEQPVLAPENEMSYVDDPLGIAKPWDEAHGKESKE